MKRTLAALLGILLGAGAATAHAQVAHSATRQPLSFRVGGMVSYFQPDYAGGYGPGASPQYLQGIGTYLDLELTRWVQIEGEARLLRFNQYHNIYQDNYLLGPRVPIYRLGRIVPYGKILFGITNMNFEYNSATCRCATIAYGGGVDLRLNRRWTLRAIDFEYQQFPNWLQGQSAQLNPYGYSAGISYRVF